jgi:single-stranded-DNA-specific exonuclease
MNKKQGVLYQWNLPPEAVKDAAVAVAHAHTLPIPIAQVLVRRGLTEDEQIRDFIFTPAATHLSDIELLAGANRAADRIIQAIEKGEKILIAGDYDVDGITSSALMMLCLRPLGAQVNFFLPHRAKDGYGLRVSTIEKAATAGYTVVITVDNGITAFEPARVARQRGIDLIITDHHRPHEQLPDAYALVNPQLERCQYPFKGFAGVGVGFKLLSLIYTKLNKQLPARAYELLLLGTVADVVPLVHENRYWVRYALRQVATEQSYALQVLKRNGALTKQAITALDVGFSLAPQINALGRLDDPREGVTFLLSHDTQIVERIGGILQQLNQARRELEKEIMQQALAAVTASGVHPHEHGAVIVAHEAWPAGVIGLVASRLVGTYQRPAMVFHLTKDGIAKGSCRSVPGFNLFQALQHCADLLLTFGGHAAAAGLSLEIDKLPAFIERIGAYCRAHLAPDSLVKQITIDAAIRLPDLQRSFLQALNYLEPFGCGNERPVFWLEQVSCLEPPQLLKQAHIKCKIFQDGVIKSVIIFNRPELFPSLTQYWQEPFDLAAYVSENEWEGRVSIELQGIDIAFGQGQA